MTTPRPLNDFPLPARIFHTAMQRQLSLDAYAATLDVPAEAMRALVAAHAEQLAPEIISQLAAAHGQQAEAGLAPLAEATAVEPFHAWLGRHMEGVSQTALRRRAQLDAPLLRAFLSGKSLPDAEQAERIARALYIDSAEMARIIVADMARRAERTRDAPARAPRRRRAADDSDAPPSPRANSGAAQAEAPPEDGGTAAPATGQRRRGAARGSATPVAQAAAPAREPAGEAAGLGLPTPAGASTTPQAEQDPPPPAPRKRRAAAPRDGLGDEAALPAARRARGPRAVPQTAQAGAPADKGGIPARPEPPDQEGAVAAQPSAPPMLAAEIRPAETALQLSPDEVRLIRSWRRLHPHGQRATLQYIGSLLVEE
jgi:hypothetical protein